MTVEYIGIEPGATGKLYDSETLNFVFKSDSSDDTIKNVMDNPDCPRMYEKHPTYRWMFASSFDYAQSDGHEWIRWVVTIEYKFIELEEGEPEPVPEPPPSTGIPPQRKPELDDDPEVRERVDYEPHVSIGYEDYSAALGDAYTGYAAQTEAFGGVRESRGVPIVNSAMEPYDPPPNIQKVNPIIDIRVNVQVESDFFTAIADPDVNGSVNLRGILYKEGKYELRVNPREARMRFSMDPVQDEELAFFGAARVRYRQVTIQLVINTDGWQPRLLDIGSYRFSIEGTDTLSDRGFTGTKEGSTPDMSFPKGPGGGSATAVPFKNDDGEPITRLLDGKGNLLKEGESPIYNTYKGYKERDFLPILHKLWSKPAFSVFSSS
jgi:hypothetical protein